MKASTILLLIILVSSCRKNGGDFQGIYLTNTSKEDIYFLLSKDEAIRESYYIKRIRPKTSYMKFDEKNFVVFDSKEDSLIARDNYMFPFRIKKEVKKQIFGSMSVDMIMNAISIQQRINTEYDGKLNIFIIKAKDLDNFSDKKIIENKLYKKIKTLTEKDITSDSLSVQYLGE